MSDHYPSYDSHQKQQQHLHHSQQQHQQHPQPLQQPQPETLHQPHPHSLPPGVIHGLPFAPPPPNLVEHGLQPYYTAPSQMGESQQLADANLARWFEQDEMSSHAPKSAVRMRRRTQAGADHVKHRRTRSGCYTCRSRRVKCDETHPICERCKKGSRECIYPEPTSATKPTSGSKLGHSRKPGDETGSSSEEFDDEDILESPTASQARMDSLIGQSSRPSSSNLRGISKKQSRATLNQVRAGSASLDRVKDKSLSPSTDESYLSRSGKVSSVSTNTSHGDAPWSHLAPDLQFYLEYHRKHLNHNFYFFKHDASHFVHNTLLDIALEYDPLLYAVAGFSAYHFTIKKPSGKIADFLAYYNKSVSLLRKSLQSNQKHTNATILTILQLAAFEEYLGDWVNLMAHQKAAYEMLNALYSPDTIMGSETSRKTFAWYARFDLFAGLMAGNSTTLSVGWFQANADWYTKRATQDPTDLDLLVESLFALHRVMAVDMAQLFARLPKCEISIQGFMKENAKLDERIQACKARLDPLLQSSDHKVMSFEGAPELDPDDFVDPYQPGTMFKGTLFSANYMLIDWYAIDAMHKYQTAMILQQQPPPGLLQSAIEQCRILESIEYWPGSPAGAILPAQASLGLICLFLPRDEKHSLWCRRKLAKIEANGYIYPPTFRSKMVEHWGISSLHHWWLENDEGYPPIIKAIRAFIEERTIKPRTQVDQDIRTMKAIFSKLSYDDSPKESPESMTSSANESGSGRQNYGSPQSGTSGSQHESQAEQSLGGPEGMEFDQATLEQFDNWDMSGGLDQSGLHRP